ncbi:hypothetical protein [Wenyingzhuangia sp. IMCC45467]
MTIQSKNITISLLKATLKICIAGVFIGLLHQKDWLVAIFLILKVVHSMYNLGFSNKQKNWIVPIGMFLSGVLGIGAEYWGISNGYWEYHDIQSLMPLWLPFAWMLAFSYVYKLEKELFAQLNKPSLKTKTYITFLLALVFPAFGEVITINLDVWTYYWPYQFLGVPLYALVCLIVFHMVVNYLMFLLSNKTNIKDEVFTMSK